MANEWKHPTMHDAVAREAAARGHAVEVDNHAVRCGGCRHPAIPLDMMTDLSGLSPAFRARLKLDHDEPFICDACRERLHGFGLVTHGELAEALGAHGAALARVHEHDEHFPYPGGSPAHAERKRRHPATEEPPRVRTAPPIDRVGRRP